MPTVDEHRSHAAIQGSARSLERIADALEALVLLLADPPTVSVSERPPAAVKALARIEQRWANRQ